MCRIPTRIRSPYNLFFSDTNYYTWITKISQKINCEIARTVRLLALPIFICSALIYFSTIRVVRNLRTTVREYIYRWITSGTFVRRLQVYYYLTIYIRTTLRRIVRFTTYVLFKSYSTCTFKVVRTVLVGSVYIRTVVRT